MIAITVTEARNKWSDLVDKVAFKGERVVLQRNGKNVVALVSAEDAEILEALEDSLDLEEAKRRLSDGRAPLDYNAVRSQLGLE